MQISSMQRISHTIQCKYVKGAQIFEAFDATATLRKVCAITLRMLYYKQPINTVEEIEK